MNKILLALLCLLTLSVSVGSTFASNDVDGMLINDSLRISENESRDISISEDTDLSETKGLNKPIKSNNPIESNKPVDCKLNNTDPNNSSDIIGPVSVSDLNDTNMDSKLIEFMKLCTILKEHKNENLLMVLQNNSDGRQVLAFYSTSGLSGASSSYVGEVGSELVDILEKEGAFEKMAYGTVWLASKIGELFGSDGLTDSEIKFLATADLSPFISWMWDDFTEDISDWWDDLWD
ncbi:hypothetical protein [Methanobrevibacter sp.]|uniref:hypothetical protein n=1 Tax=Methanobrevibacter sp. TaxID=66852 RepID=UPI00388E31A2